jgi:hypothetical protein
MNEELLKTFCNTCVDFCDTHDLGVYMVIAHKEGLFHLNKFPNWSVLQYQENEEQVKLVIDKDEPAKQWFIRLNNTINFLEELSKDSSLMSELSSNLKNLLESTLHEVFEDSKLKNQLH